MVWAMREPGSFGDFFPDGTFSDWSQSIADHLCANGDADIAKQIASFEYPISQFSPIVDICHAASNKFVKDKGDLKEFEKPKNFITTTSYTNLASFIKTENRLVAVDDDLKLIIETLEPGVHQFWPITITMPKGRTYPKQYYGMRIAQFLDSFSPEESDEGSWRVGGLHKDKFRVKFPNKKEMNGLAMSAPTIGTAHLWRENKLRDPHYFFSDVLHDAIADAGLRVPTFYQLKVVHGADAPLSRSQTTAHSNAQKPAAKSLISKLFSRNR